MRPSWRDSIQSARPAPRGPPTGAVAALAFVVVLALSLGLGLGLGLRPAPDMRPQSAYVLETNGTAYLYAAAAYAGTQYLALEWRERGTLYSAGRKREDVAACPFSPPLFVACTMLLVLDERTQDIKHVLRLPDALTTDVRVNATHVVLMGVGYMGNGYAVPDARGPAATVVDRGYTNHLGFVLTYHRDSMRYAGSAFVMPAQVAYNDPFEAYYFRFWSGFRIQRGFLSEGTFGLSFVIDTGNDAEDAEYRVTPLLLHHGPSTAAQDAVVPVRRDYSVCAAFVWKDREPLAAWQGAGTVYCAGAITHSPELGYVTYGIVYVSEGETAIDAPTMQRIHDNGTAEAAAVAVSLPAVHGRPTMLIMRFDTDTLRFVSYIREDARDAISYVVQLNGTRATSRFTHSNDTSSSWAVYDVNSSVPAGTMSAPSVKVSGCTWDFATSALVECAHLTAPPGFDVFVSQVHPLVALVTSASPDGARVNVSRPWVVGDGEPQLAESVEVGPAPQGVVFLSPPVARRQVGASGYGDVGGMLYAGNSIWSAEAEGVIRIPV